MSAIEMICHLSEQNNWWGIITCSMYLSVLCGAGSASQGDTITLRAVTSGSERCCSWWLSSSMSVPLSHVLKIRHTVRSWMCRWILPLLKLPFIQMRTCSEALHSQSNELHKENWGYSCGTFNTCHSNMHFLKFVRLYL